MNGLRQNIFGLNKIEFITWQDYILRYYIRNINIHSVRTRLFSIRGFKL